MKVAATLGRKGFENYCPLNKVLHRQWNDRKKWFAGPLFPSYVFVRTEEAHYPRLAHISGVLHLVYWLCKPAIVKQEEIDAIRILTGEYSHLRLEKTAASPGDPVRVIRAPLITQEGEVIGLNTKTVKVRLPSIGYFILAEYVPTIHQSKHIPI